MHQILLSHLLIFLGGGRKNFELPCTLKQIDINHEIQETKFWESTT